jgi:hypothetical protein
MINSRIKLYVILYNIQSYMSIVFYYIKTIDMSIPNELGISISDEYKLYIYKHGLDSIGKVISVIQNIDKAFTVPGYNNFIAGG